ncbi:unnamed protein product [Pylaiella littoralis]
MGRQHYRPRPVRLLVLALACFSLLLFRHDGGGAIAQGNGDDDDGGGSTDDDDGSNDDDGIITSLSPTGAPTSLDEASDYPNCTGYTSHIKDGYCDTDLNNADCGFDGGDCCACTCGSEDEEEELPYACGQVGDGFDCQDPDVPPDCGVTPSPAASFGYPDCTGYLHNFQDSYCNDDLNNAACGYDGGDCCRCTCRDYGSRTTSAYYYYYRYDYGYTCGQYGYDCLDPEAPSSCSTDSPTPSPAAGTDYPECDGTIVYIADGVCDYSNNNEECAWDGGDCCACTCTSFDGTCGYYGYNCLDPTVSTECSSSTSGYYGNTGYYSDDVYGYYGDDDRSSTSNLLDDDSTSNSPGYTGGQGDDDGYVDRDIATPSPAAPVVSPDTGVEGFEDDSSEPLLSNVEIGGVVALSVLGLCCCGVAISAAFGRLPLSWLSRNTKRGAPDTGAGAVEQAPTAPVAGEAKS